MYLKALEIQGFKSFPEKLILPFDKRMIAIVGPNGSGKSNISDAICWVMGEQRSKTLRGAKMEDVIFGGTAQRGPSGFAQVSLILGNEDRSLKTDADEVAITRCSKGRITFSGKDLKPWISSAFRYNGPSLRFPSFARHGIYSHSQSILL